MQKYYEKLPRPLQASCGHRCEALLDHGERCSRIASVEDSVHLDGEIYTGMSWVAVKLCKQHAIEVRPQK